MWVMKKLSNTKIRRIIKMKLLSKTNKEIAKMFDITPRRVQQLFHQYWKDGKGTPKLMKCGRKSENITKSYKKLIVQEYKRSMVGALYLEQIIQRKHKIHIPHNRIHMVLKEHNLANEEINKQKRRKWVRYERKHSLSLIHTDWFEHNGKNVIIFEDDASRRILGGGEFDTATSENTVLALKQVLKACKDYGPVHQVLTDNGTQFVVNEGEVRRGGKTQFQRILEKYGIQHLRSRVKHPQTNGKLEKLVDLYKRRRHQFKSFKAFVKWYNEIKPHRSLDFERAETPSEAFMRKMRPEYLVGMVSRLGWW